MVPGELAGGGDAPGAAAGRDHECDSGHGEAHGDGAGRDLRGVMSAPGSLYFAADVIQPWLRRRPGSWLVTDALSGGVRMTCQRCGVAVTASRGAELTVLDALTCECERRQHAESAWRAYFGPLVDLPAEAVCGAEHSERPAPPDTIIDDDPPSLCVATGLTPRPSHEPR